jgi:hypothetical protein
VWRPSVSQRRALGTIAVCLALTATAHADETAEKQKAAAESEGAPGEAAEEAKANTPEAEKEATNAKGGEKANEVVRAKEGAKTALPSVAGRPVRRYAEQGILELGGNLSVVKANAFTQVGASPFFGWFFIDYVQLSFIPSIEYVKTFDASAKSRYSAILEPSFHVQIVDVVFGFFGAGAGIAYEKQTGVGLAVAPRTGINLLIGGSGVLTAALSFVYTATKRTAIEDGSTDPHTSTIGFQIGYSVAW